MSARIAVVGAGVMGLATAYALARQGAEVVVYEQFAVGHDRGSSHGRSRIFRLAYAEPEWVRLGQEALAGWRELEADSGDELLVLNGLVEVVQEREFSSCDALDACGAEWEVLSEEEAERRFPLRLAPGAYAIFQPDAGVVLADRALRAFHDGATRRGVAVEDGRRIERLSGVAADAVVVTAGGWARKLLAAEGIPLDVTVTRETVAYFRLRTDKPVPSVALLHPGTTKHAVYALEDPHYGLKLGCHMCGPEADPDQPGEPDPRLVHVLSRWAGEHFPGADPTPAAAQSCIYTTTPDERFVLERHGRIVVGSPCSGHGFKFAPAIGERLARLALDAVAVAA